MTNKPTHDKHLLNLRSSRLKALVTYRKSKTLLRKYALNRLTMRARYYTESLIRQRCKNHCVSFNERTNECKLWATFKGMLGKRKKTNTRENVMFRNGITKEQLVGKTRDLLILKPPNSTESEEAKDPVLPLEPMGSPFPIGQLVVAFRKAKKYGPKNRRNHLDSHSKPTN